jgi:sulfur-carrier protein
MGTITVELFSIPRQRAGVPLVRIEAARLGEALAALAARFPELARDCFDGGALRPGIIANINGRRFVRDPATPLADGDRLLLMSADAGG